MKMMVLVGLFVVPMIFLSGCATQKEWMALGGSRSDGTVKLAYEYGMFEKPVIERAQGYNLALQKCQVWGYSGTEPFGSTMSQCIATNQYGCVRWRVTAEFQCTTNSQVGSVDTVQPLGPVQPVGPRISEKEAVKVNEVPKTETTSKTSTETKKSGAPEIINY